MKNKKGFTLVELSLSIVIILLIGLMVIPNLIDLGDNSNKEIRESKLGLALTGAYKYGVDNIDELSSSCTEVTIGELINLEYMDGDDTLGENLIDPITGLSMNGTVICVYYDRSEVRVSVK